MKVLLQVDVRWVDDRYHGEEWPPSPFKLQQALVRVAADQGADSLYAALPLLSMLETAPVIEHVPASRGRPMRLSVPNNGGGNAMPIRRAWFMDRVAQLPDVRYLFPINPEAKGLAELQSLLQRVHTIGLGIDSAFLDTRFCDQDQPRRLPIRIEPRPRVGAGPGTSNADSGLLRGGNRKLWPGPTLRVANVDGTALIVHAMDEYFGRLDALWQDALRRHNRRSFGIKPQVSISRPRDVGFHTRSYRLVDGESFPKQPNGMVAASRYQVATFNVDPVSGVYPEALFSAKLAAMMRHACHNILRAYLGHSELWDLFVRGPVCGHGANVNQRIAFAPLPNYTGSYPNGRLRRALVAIPEAVCSEFPEQVRELMFRLRGGLNLLEEPASQGPYVGDRSFAMLLPAESDDHSFQLLLGISKTWGSVSPVILHGHDRTRSGRISRTKLERLLGNALKQVELEGLLAHYEISQVCYLPGLPLAKRFFRPENLNGPNRAICHLKLTFKYVVSGPLLLGLGRHRGLGLFAPANHA